MLKQRHEFNEKHKDDYITVCAWGSWHEAVPAGKVGVHAVKGGRLPSGQYVSDDHAWFLVDAQVYREWCNEYHYELGYLVGPGDKTWVDHA